jgi:hypothetical protein
MELDASFRGKRVWMGHPGLLHSVALRPYGGMEKVQMRQKMCTLRVGVQ